MSSTVDTPRLMIEPEPLAPERCGPDALSLGGGPLCFERVRWSAIGDGVAVTRLGRGTVAEMRAAARDLGLEDAAESTLERLCAPRGPVLGLAARRPLVMGVLNVTPDSFSDGGRHLAPERAIEGALAMIEAGADIIDIGGESTRPGAEPVSVSEELDRVLPVLDGLRAAGIATPLSIDTRNAAVARAAFAAGARLFNDVSALTHDPDSRGVAAELLGATDGWVCLMHARGEPRTMQTDPRYRDAPVEVALALEARMDEAVAAGIPRERIIVDPGIGFGKTIEHNIALIRRLALLQGLGAPVLLGASRKRFIGEISGVADAAERYAGSLAVALEGARRGAQILRVHDVAETVQALKLWAAFAGVDWSAPQAGDERSRG